MLTKTSLLALAVSFALSFGVPAHAQAYPHKPVRLIVGLPAGGGVDITARITGAKLSEFWGQQVVVENRPGAGTTIAADIVAKATPDGYTLLQCGIGSHGIAPSLYKKLPYDHIKDFAPISIIGTTPNVLVVHPAVPVKSMSEFIAYAKANPGKLSYGSAGAGSSPHLTMELFKSMTAIDIVHVPYKGGPPALADVLGGQIPAVVDILSTLVAPVKAGKLRALGVTSAKRHALLPEVPTIAESGVPGFAVTSWSGMCAPAAVPKPIIAKLNADVAKALNMPDVLRRLAEQGVEAVPSSPEQFATFIKSETIKWAKVVKDAGATVE